MQERKIKLNVSVNPINTNEVVVLYPVISVDRKGHETVTYKPIYNIDSVSVYDQNAKYNAGRLLHKSVLNTNPLVIFYNFKENRYVDATTVSFRNCDCAYSGILNANFRSTIDFIRTILFAAFYHGSSVVLVINGFEIPVNVTDNIVQILSKNGFN